MQTLTLRCSLTTGATTSISSPRSCPAGRCRRASGCSWISSRAAGGGRVKVWVKRSNLSARQKREWKYEMFPRERNIRELVSCRSALTVHRGTAHGSPIARPGPGARRRRAWRRPDKLYDLQVTRPYCDPLPAVVRDHRLPRHRRPRLGDAEAEYRGAGRWGGVGASDLDRDEANTGLLGLSRQEAGRGPGRPRLRARVDQEIDGLALAFSAMAPAEPAPRACQFGARHRADADRGIKSSGYTDLMPSRRVEFGGYSFPRSIPTGSKCFVRPALPPAFRQRASSTEITRLSN